MWRQGTLVLLMSLGYSGACSVGDIKLDCEDPSLCDEDGNPLPVQYAARGVDVVEVALYQTVKVPLMENGTAQNSSVGVVGDKDALIRVFVEPHAAFSSRTIVARLTLDTGAEAPVIYEESYAVTGTSSESSLSSTINFNVMGADLPPGTTWALELLESEMDFEGSEDLGRDHWPEEGSDALLPENMGGALKIQILPVRYNADGSGRLPDTTSSRIRQFEEKMSQGRPERTIFQPKTAHSNTDWSPKKRQN